MTPKEYDEEMIIFSKEIKTPYQYLIHGTFLRDGTEKEIEAHVKWICEFAVERKAPMVLGLATVPLGTDFSKIDSTFFMN